MKTVEPNFTSFNTGKAILKTYLSFPNGLAKIKIALAKGKRQYDKREDIKKKDVMRDMQRSMKNE